MTTIQSSGIEPGQRRLNGPQTTGRNYRNLSQPAYGMTRDDDVAVLMRDGVTLLADVHHNTGDIPYWLPLHLFRDRFKTLVRCPSTSGRFGRVYGPNLRSADQDPPIARQLA